MTLCLWQIYVCYRGRWFKESFIQAAVKFSNTNSPTAAGVMKTRRSACLCCTYVRYTPSISLEYSQPALKLGTCVMNCQTQLSYWYVFELPPILLFFSLLRPSMNKFTWSILFSPVLKHSPLLLYMYFFRVVIPQHFFALTFAISSPWIYANRKLPTSVYRIWDTELAMYANLTFLWL